MSFGCKIPEVPVVRNKAVPDFRKPLELLSQKIQWILGKGKGRNAVKIIGHIQVMIVVDGTAGRNLYPCFESCPSKGILVSFVNQAIAFGTNGHILVVGKTGEKTQTKNLLFVQVGNDVIQIQPPGKPTLNGKK